MSAPDPLKAELLRLAGETNDPALREWLERLGRGESASGSTANQPQHYPRGEKQRQSKRAQVDWPNPTQPYLYVGYHGPAFSDTQIDMPALDLVSQLLFSEAAPLYQKLVNEEQEIVHMSPRAGRYLQMPGGEPTHDVEPQKKEMPEPITPLKIIARMAPQWACLRCSDPSTMGSKAPMTITPMSSCHRAAAIGSPSIFAHLR